MYWRDIKLCHKLDVMHIEKNICNNILGTIMNINEKTKDTIKMHPDLEKMGLRSTLRLLKDGDKLKKPLAPYTLSPLEIHMLF